MVWNLQYHCYMQVFYCHRYLPPLNIYSGVHSHTPESSDPIHSALEISACYRRRDSHGKQFLGSGLTIPIQFISDVLYGYILKFRAQQYYAASLSFLNISWYQ